MKGCLGAYSDLEYQWTGIITKRKGENDMKKLKGGSEQLTRNSVLRNINFYSSCATEKWRDFEAWANQANIGVNHLIFVGEDGFFWRTWLHDKPFIQQWLIEKNYAEWDHLEPEPKKPDKIGDRIEEWKKERPKPGDYRYQNRETGKFLDTYFEMDLETWLSRMPIDENGRIKEVKE